MTIPGRPLADLLASLPAMPTDLAHSTLRLCENLLPRLPKGQQRSDTVLWIEALKQELKGRRSAR